MRLITIGQAARLLSLDPTTLRRKESPDGQWAEVYGHRLRIHRLSPGPGGQRRYDEDEIHRLLARIGRS